MSRARVVSVAVLLWAGPVFAVPGSYLVGSVGLTYLQPPGQKVGSSAYADCFTYFGSPDTSCFFSGTQWIEFASGGVVIAARYSAVGIEWTGYLPTVTTGDTCYRAKLTGPVSATTMGSRSRKKS